MTIPAASVHRRPVWSQSRVAEGISASAIARRAMRHASALMLAIAACVLLVIAPNTEAQAASESQVKAAFLYNFAKFVEWPSQSFPDGNTPVVIGVIGDEHIADALDQICKGRTIDGRRLVSRRLSSDGNTEGCHILFVAATEKRHISAILDRLGDSSVLTVGDTEGFISNGGMVGFVIQKSKIGFEVNAGAAKRKRLKISSQLLKLAKDVRE
jgi:hypothetical protein